jgi:hypothetical protein
MIPNYYGIVVQSKNLLKFYYQEIALGMEGVTEISNQVISNGSVIGFIHLKHVMWFLRTEKRKD